MSDSLAETVQAEARCCKWCDKVGVFGRGLCQPCYQREYAQRVAAGTHEPERKLAGDFIEPVGGRWWRDCLSDEARDGLNKWLETREGECRHDFPA